MVTLCGHLKTDSLSPKRQGQRIAKGEYSTSYWSDQAPHAEPFVNAVHTHGKAPVLGCPQAAEAANFSDRFAPGDTAFFGRYYTDQQTGTITRINRPRVNPGLLLRIAPTGLRYTSHFHSSQR